MAATGSAFVGTEMVALLKELGDRPVRTVACVGARGTGKSTMLRSMFGPDVAPVAEEQGIALLEAASGFEYNSEAGGYRVGTRDTSVAVAVSDVVIFNVLAQDLAREGATASLEALQPALETLLSHYAAGLLAAAHKKSLMVAVRDFDGTADDEAAVQSAVAAALETAWGRVIKPVGYRDASLDDILDVSVRFLPHYSFAGDSYQDSVGRLRSAVLETAAANPETPAAEVARRLRVLIAGAGPAVEPAAGREVLGACVAETAGAAASAELRVQLKALDAPAPRSSGGETAPTFGARCDAALEAVLKAYDEAVTAGHAAGTAAAARKRVEVRAAALRAFEARYDAQLDALRAASLLRFNKGLAAMRGSSALAKELEDAAVAADKGFVEAARRLKPRTAAWPHEAARRSLREAVRETSDERLQIARLQGGPSAVGRTRRPVGVAFHWLLPEPFGQGSRTSYLQPESELRYAGDAAGADPMFFEFAPLDDVRSPKARKVEEPAGWDNIRQRAERMVYRSRQQ